MIRKSILLTACSVLSVEAVTEGKWKPAPGKLCPYYVCRALEP